jgi:PTH2 family peptidyl-tRNA hydrolase
MKQVIVFRSDLKIGKGKMAAHAAHAGITGYERVMSKKPAIVKEWLYEGQKKIVLKVNSEQEMIELYERIKRSVPSVLIRDAGHTQVEPGTLICLVIGPWEDEDIDRFIEGMKLL